jgi:hypothetical protein
MAGKSSLKWPVFIIVSAVSVALTWKYSPMLKTRLPERVTKTARNIVSAARGDFSFINEAQPPSQERRVEFIYVTKNGERITNLVSEASTDAPSNSTDRADAGKRRSSLAAIARTQTLQAKWAVLQKKTQVLNLDDSVMGNAPAGAVFFIEKKLPGDSGMIYEGRFHSTKMTKTVRIVSSDVISFSGDFNQLPDAQKEALKKYYELTGKAEERKAEVLKENLAKSPYLSEAAKELKKYNTATERFKSIKNPSEDFRREATYKLSQLKDKIQTLNQKHKEWKETHQAELGDYTSDAKYNAIIAEREKYRDEIPELAY